MNERIKELAEQAGYNTSPYCRIDREFDVFEIERFAELVRQDEREACAKLCEKLGEAYVDMYAVRSTFGCAAAIRARSKHD